MSSFDLDFGKIGFARDLLRLRSQRLKLSQKAFAERYGLSWSNIRDQEQGRFEPSAALRLIIIAIELDPGLVERAARIAATRPLGEYDPDVSQGDAAPVKCRPSAGRHAGHPQFPDPLNEQGEELSGHIARAREAGPAPLHLAGAPDTRNSRANSTSRRTRNA